jgi:hypothetical protein
MRLQAITTSQDYPHIPLNENFEALQAASLFGIKWPTSVGLVFGYYGGYIGAVLIDDGTIALAASATNYVERDSAGTVTKTTTAFTPGLTPIAKITTSATGISTYEDYRVLPWVSTTIGKHSLSIMAPQMRPSVAGGSAALAGIASAANQPDIVTLDFDTTTQEYAQFSIAMPKSWNEGTITFKAIWSHAATTVNFGVAWGLQAVAISNDDPIAVAFGTAVEVTDTGGTTNDVYVSPESAAITVGGTPQPEDVVFFRIFRNPANAADNMAIDARLHGIFLYFTTAAETDV